jgi:hypothetical protein
MMKVGVGFLVRIMSWPRLGWDKMGPTVKRGGAVWASNPWVQPASAVREATTPPSGRRSSPWPPHATILYYTAPAETPMCCSLVFVFITPPSLSLTLTILTLNICFVKMHGSFTTS